MLVPNVYILGGGIYKFNKSIYHLKEMRYVLIVQILDGTSYWANQKISSMIGLGNSLILCTVKVIWYFQQRTINHYITKSMRSTLSAGVHFIWEFILAKEIISYKHMFVCCLLAYDHWARVSEHLCLYCDSKKRKTLVLVLWAYHPITEISSGHNNQEGNE